MIVRETKKIVHFSLTEVMSDFLWENRIFFSLQEKRARARPGSVLQVPRSAILEPYVTFNAGLMVMSIGANSYTNSEGDPLLTLGRHCSIAPGLRLSGFEHPMGALMTGLFAYDRQVNQMLHVMRDMQLEGLEAAKRSARPSQVTLGHDVWVGADVWMRRGIKVGTGAIIAANAVVTKDVPAYAVVGGNPARTLKMRFPEELIQRLLSSRWWRLSLAQLAQFPFTDAAAFMDSYDERDGASLPAWEPKPLNLADELMALC